jgi:Mn-dependent DtxR family transcriptional regulator
VSKPDQHAARLTVSAQTTRHLQLARSATAGSSGRAAQVGTAFYAGIARDALVWMAVAGPALTDSIQDYLKAIYKLQEGEARVSVTALAREQGVAAGSASEMVKKLAALELVDHAPYKGVRLTAAGERVAVEVIRHHRLLELYLAETLGLDVDDVHDEADRLEHVLSEELEARIDRALGFPTHDPHGDPIPNAALEWPKSRTG